MFADIKIYQHVMEKYVNGYSKDMAITNLQAFAKSKIATPNEKTISLGIVKAYKENHFFDINKFTYGA